MLETPHHAAARRPQVGEPMPDLTLRGLDGQPFPLSRLRGKRALIFMWASW
jgi:peroxiredoxin